MMMLATAKVMKAINSLLSQLTAYINTDQVEKIPIGTRKEQQSITKITNQRLLILLPLPPLLLLHKHLTEINITKGPERIPPVCGGL
jgi:hypothetical protein